MSRFQLFSFSSDQKLADACARRFLELLTSSERKRPFYLALAGGRITGRFFTAIVSQAEGNAGAFESVHFFWGDERCVSPTDPESNFGLAQRLLLKPLHIPTEYVHRIRGELAPYEAAAQANAEILRTVRTESSEVPVLDLIFLGMGEDGHIASLFPDESRDAIASSEIYRPVVASKPPPNRITLNYRTLAAAHQVWVLASGTGKQTALAESLKPNGITPLARLLQMRSNTLIFTDVPQQ